MDLKAQKAAKAWCFFFFRLRNNEVVMLSSSKCSGCVPKSKLLDKLCAVIRFNAPLANPFKEKSCLPRETSLESLLCEIYELINKNGVQNFQHFCIKRSLLLHLKTESIGLCRLVISQGRKPLFLANTAHFLKSLTHLKPHKVHKLRLLFRLPQNKSSLTVFI